MHVATEAWLITIAVLRRDSDRRYPHPRPQGEGAVHEVLSKPVTGSILLGGSKVEQLRDYVAAASKGPLSEDLVTACDQVGKALRGLMPGYNRCTSALRTCAWPSEESTRTTRTWQPSSTQRWCGSARLPWKRAQKRIAEGFTFITIASDLTHLETAAAAHLRIALGTAATEED